ncbi:MAG: GGDEF domain-containing protein [Candidatus Gracilibacteria bacterium]|nr:GGDEF domain-containing protein [Candidatus Gracilibacteria bacterium]
MTFGKLKNQVTSKEFKSILRLGTQELNSFILRYTRKIQEQVAEIYGNKEELIKRTSPMSQEIVDMAKVNFVKIFFSVITEKFRKMKFYDEETLLNTLEKFLNKYLNGRLYEKNRDKVNIENIIENGEIIVNIFKINSQGLVDMMQINSNDGRKIFLKKTTDNENNGIEQIILRILNNNQETNKKLNTKNCYEFQKLTNKIGAIVINRIDGTKFIITFNNCDNFKSEIMEIIGHDIIELIKDKLNEVIYRYTNRVSNCKNSNYFNEIGESKDYAVFAIDLNNFKYFNDTFGHTQGDIVLKKFGELLKSCIRENEGEVIHLSGDEFVIVINIKEKNSKNILEIIEQRIHKKIDDGFFKIQLINKDGNSIENNIGFSMGKFLNENNDTKLVDGYSKADMNMLSTKPEEGYLYRIIQVMKTLGREDQKKGIKNLGKMLGINLLITDKK